MMLQGSNKAGFTIVEILVGMIIVGIITTVLVYVAKSGLQNSKISGRLSNSNAFLASEMENIRLKAKLDLLDKVGFHKLAGDSIKKPLDSLISKWEPWTSDSTLADATVTLYWRDKNGVPQNKAIRTLISYKLNVK